MSKPWQQEIDEWAARVADLHQQRELAKPHPSAKRPFRDAPTVEYDAEPIPAEEDFSQEAGE